MWAFVQTINSFSFGLIRAEGLNLITTGSALDDKSKMTEEGAWAAGPLFHATSGFVLCVNRQPPQFLLLFSSRQLRVQIRFFLLARRDSLNVNKALDEEGAFQEPSLHQTNR